MARVARIIHIFFKSDRFKFMEKTLNVCSAGLISRINQCPVYRCGTVVLVRHIRGIRGITRAKHKGRRDRKYAGEGSYLM
jgi:hypothetical protein